MHQITDQAVSLNKEITQYYGKWPFYCLWEIQESTSILFSILNVGYGLLYIICVTSPRAKMRNTKYTTIWTLICLLAFSAHVSYLHFFKFDYEYNIIANIGISLLNNLIWVGWSLTHWHRRPDDYWKPLVIVALIIITTSLEVFDFPSWWRIFDAYSLWHASTIYIIASWYKFILEDARIESFRKNKGKKIDK
ncbi:14622_t:CDS:2 [Acaulospora morrowiae]|uniref:Post-GPI attachment to proteins factor 3 n=1 Tax=Acaulospora morrowiae TaxID=94023 RepID=A0A9N9F1G3_9GLOM|nr:14622_t:CDS:2 [Acaulospora morrowiae]